MTVRNNLTRDEARLRAGLLAVEGYVISLDLTDGRGRPGSADLPLAQRDHASPAASPVPPPSSRWSRAPCTRSPSTASPSSPPAWSRPAGWPSTGSRRGQRAGRRRRLPLHQHRRGAAPLRRPRGRPRLPLQPVRDGRRQADVRLLRPARPQGHVRRDRHRAGRLAGRHQRRPPPPPRPSTSGAVRHAFERTARMSTYVTALVAGPYHVRPRPPRRHPARAVLPGQPRRAPRRRRAVHRHQAGLRLLPRGLRLPVPVRQVRPALRAGVQRRRDGERRRRDVPRGLRLPLQGHRRRPTSAAPRRCCTRWRTCGSATSSRCAGGTTSGSTRASRPS